MRKPQCSAARRVYGAQSQTCLQQFLCFVNTVAVAADAYFSAAILAMLGWLVGWLQSRKQASTDFPSASTPRIGAAHNIRAWTFVHFQPVLLARVEDAAPRLPWRRPLSDTVTISPPLAFQVLSMGVHKAAITRGTQPASARDAAECGVRLLHAINMYDVRMSEEKAAAPGLFTNVTDWQWVLDRTQY